MENISLLLGFNVRYNVFLWSKDTYKMHVLYIYHIYKSIQYAYKNQWIYPVHRIFSVFSEKITFCQAIVVFTQRESWLTARLFQPQNYCLLPLSLKKKNFWMNCFTRSFSQFKHLYYTKISLKYYKISQLTVVSKCGISKQKTLPDFIEKTMFLDFSFWVIGKTQKICMWEVSDVGI